jgi:hypothetical protein
MRSKLEDRYAPFVQPAEKETLLAVSQEAEEGEDAPKSVYVSRLEKLHALGNPITARWRVRGTPEGDKLASRDDQYVSGASYFRRGAIRTPRRQG